MENRSALEQCISGGEVDEGVGVKLVVSEEASGDAGVPTEVEGKFKEGLEVEDSQGRWK